MKNLKIFLALLLALTMVVSMAACGGNNAGKETDPKGTDAPAGNDDTAGGDDTTAAPGEDMSWLNLGGVYPIVDEGVEKTLTLVLPISDETIDTYKERWQYIMVNEVLNINLEVSPVASSAWGEKLPLILADTENLPDIIMNTGWNSAMMLRYGAQEGLIVDIAPYINENYMPCLASLFTDHPEYKIPWTDSEGHVWGVGIINHIDRSDEMQWHYLNYQWMVDCGLDPVEDMPTTLDEFTDLMRLFKEKKSAEFGHEIYPISGKYSGWNSIYRYLLAALGFVGSNRGDVGMDINLRNGEVVLPVADEEGWTAYIETVKLWYEERLVHPEYFTGDSSAIEALVSAGETGYTTVPPFIWVGSEPERLGQWWGAPLLSSKWCEKPGVPSNAAANGGPNHVITTACEELELALAFYDWFFYRGTEHNDTNYFWQNGGLTDDHPLAEKYPDFVVNNYAGDGSDRTMIERKPEAMEGYIDGNDFIAKKLALWGNVSIGYRVYEDENGTPICEGQPEQFELIDQYMNKGPQAWVELPKETIAKYMQGMPYRIFNDQYQVASNEEFPAVVYLSAEQTELAADLKVAIKEYADTETAKFITGERDLAELPDYFAEVKALGADELVQIYADYFAAING